MKRTGSLLLAICLTGCALEPPMDLFAPTEEMLRARQRETRRYEGLSEQELLAASVSVLQDMGFVLTETNTKLGVLTGSKNRKGNVFQTNQDISVTLVISPVLDSQGTPILKQHSVRVNFNRVVLYTNGKSKAENLNDPQLFTEFHDKLSKSVFIEGQKL